jgi:hypothetical protein
MTALFLKWKGSQILSRYLVNGLATNTLRGVPGVQITYALTALSAVSADSLSSCAEFQFSAHPLCNCAENGSFMHARLKENIMRNKAHSRKIAVLGSSVEPALLARPLGQAGILTLDFDTNIDAFGH